MMAAVLWSGYAAAQGGNAARGQKSGDLTKKEVKFEVVSLRPVKVESEGMHSYGHTPDGLATSLSLYQMIMFAYSPDDLPTWISGKGVVTLQNAPAWLYDEYAINARVADEDREAWRNQGRNQELLGSALRDVLKERCKFAMHEVPTEIPDFKLVVASKKGPKLKATAAGSALPNGGVSLASGGVMVGEREPARWHYYGATMADLANFLTKTAGRPVRDMTGLTGRYEFTIQVIDNPSYDPDEKQDNWPLDSLGLALRPGKGAGITLVIDHIEKPTPN
jgi:uncharacterized protein (TIGR03435 family)